MSMTHSVDHQTQRVLTHATGAINFKQIKEHLEREIQDGAASYAELFDASGATAAFSSADVRKIVDLLRQAKTGQELGVTAFVVTDTASFGLLRMLSTLADDVCKIEVFRDRAEAEKWLGWDS